MFQTEEFEKLGNGKLRLAVVDGDTMGFAYGRTVCRIGQKIEPASAIIIDIVNGAGSGEERLKRFAD